MFVMVSGIACMSIRKVASNAPVCFGRGLFAVLASLGVLIGTVPLAHALQVVGEPAVTDDGELPPVGEAVDDGGAVVTGEDGTAAAAENVAPMPAPVSAAPAAESNIDPFAAMLTRRGPSAIRLSSRVPQLYKTTEGDETFLFQVDGRRGLIRFPCTLGDDTLECALLAWGGAEETMILSSRRSPRGDVTWSDQGGAAVLRVTSNGGATLFPPDETAQALADDSVVPLGGRAVLPVSRSSGSLKPVPMSYEVAASRMQRASDLINERHGTFITFMAPGEHSGDQGVLADAVLTAAKGIDMVAADALGARIIGERLAVVEFVPDRKAGLSLQEGALTVTYNPAGGVAGRPSSIAVARYLEANL